MKGQVIHISLLKCNLFPEREQDAKQHVKNYVTRCINTDELRCAVYPEERGTHLYSSAWGIIKNSKYDK